MKKMNPNIIRKSRLDMGLVTIQSANAHTMAWLYGYDTGLLFGKQGEDNFDDNPCNVGSVSYHGYDVNLTADHNSERCHAGYDKGWNTTCREAFKDPNAGYDIYGCPGISDAAISHQLKIDAIKANRTGGAAVCGLIKKS